MSVLLRVGTWKAFLAAGQWTSASARLERSLNDATLAWILETGGPSIREQNQERAVAQEMARRFNGEIVLQLRPASRASERSFWAQRQLQLDFTADPLIFSASPVGGRPRKAATGKAVKPERSAKARSVKRAAGADA
ncbi:MAG: hypothetical protein IT163_10170 [Bryobacterales bacterium]|nr:hypothetical protein [Bryobacterales bacterium]